VVGQEAMWLTCLLEGRKEVPNRGKIKTSDSFKDAVELLSDNIFLIIIEREQKKKERSNQSLSIFIHSCYTCTVSKLYRHANMKEIMICWAIWDSCSNSKFSL